MGSAGGGGRLQSRGQGRLRLGGRIERVHDTSISGSGGLDGPPKMLVVFYNAVKVESVPLKFDEFSSSTQAQRARRILEDPGQPRGAHQCPEEPAVVRRQHTGRLGGIEQVEQRLPLIHQPVGVEVVPVHRGALHEGADTVDGRGRLVVGVEAQGAAGCESCCASRSPATCSPAAAPTCCPNY